MDTSRRLAFAFAENSRNTNAKALNTLCHYKTSLEQISKQPPYILYLTQYTM